MNSGFLMWTIMAVIFLSLALIIAFYDVSHDESMVEDRSDLKEVVYASTSCSKNWRGELAEMWNDPEHDYKKDSIFIEYSDALEADKNAVGGESK